MNKMLLNLLQTMIIPLLGTIIEKLTPTIRAELTEYLQGWYIRALATETQADNWLSKFLLNVLSIPIPESPEIPDEEKGKTLADTIKDIDPSLLFKGDN